MSTWDDKPNDYEHAIAQIAGQQENLRRVIAWLRRNANAEKEPKARAAFIEAHNAVLKIAESAE